VIVGGGLAGGNAAVTLREEVFTGRVILAGDHRSEEDLDGWYVKPEGWYQEHDVERLGESDVVAVDPSAHTVALDSGRELEH
jgi:3-phenylpropionate/trans-cinnamate dioxygenase ferredoxin reductase subunit